LTVKVSEAVASRRSVRGFTPRPVPGDVIRRVVEHAARAPSGCNLQPWHVHIIGGTVLDELKAVMRRRVAEAPAGEPPEYPVNPPQLRQMPEHQRRMFEVAAQLYDHVGVARDDRTARIEWFAQNYQCFGAPVALFCTVDKRMGPPQWSDLGMYLQSVMLLLREEGLDSCPQESWAAYPITLRAFLEFPPERMLFCGMSIGYADVEAPANRMRSQRVPLSCFAEFKGL